ncbi:MAG: hypothetical protein M1816_001693 [Peltula sp. TS41687]|nr:MAG: hypothetical protein M1816_001693 [Peltula sp. TS41687]
MADPEHAARLSEVTWTRLDARPADVSEVTRPTRLRHMTLALRIRACEADSRRNQLGHTALDPYSGIWPLQRPQTPQTAPEFEPPYTNWMGRPISLAGYAWQINLPYDSNFDEAMEYDSGKAMEV